MVNISLHRNIFLNLIFLSALFFLGFCSFLYRIAHQKPCFWDGILFCGRNTELRRFHKAIWRFFSDNSKQLSYISQRELLFVDRQREQHNNRRGWKVQKRQREGVGRSTKTVVVENECSSSRRVICTRHRETTTRTKLLRKVTS